MKRILFSLLGFMLLGTTGCSAVDHDFDSVVAGVEHRYSVHAQRVPLMSFVSICAMLKTRGGVNDCTLQSSTTSAVWMERTSMHCSDPRSGKIGSLL